MTGTLLASPVNAAGAAPLTFYIPVGLFVIVATTLYLLFSRPHRRVPAYLGPARQAGGVTGTAAAAARYVSVPETTTATGPAAGPPGDQPAGEAGEAAADQQEAQPEQGTEDTE